MGQYGILHVTSPAYHAACVMFSSDPRVLEDLAREATRAGIKISGIAPTGVTDAQMALGFEAGPGNAQIYPDRVGVWVAGVVGRLGWEPFAVDGDRVVFKKLLSDVSAPPLAEAVEEKKAVRVECWKCERPLNGERYCKVCMADNQ